MLNILLNITWRKLRFYLISFGCALFFWLSLMVSPTLAQAPSIEQLTIELDRAAELVEAGDLSQAKALLRELSSTGLEDGTELSLASEGWISLVDEAPEEAAEALRLAASSLRQPATTLPNESQQQLEEVLARPEFQPTQPTLWERIIGWLLQRLPSSPTGTGADIVRQLLFWLMALISGVVVLAVLFSFLRGLRQNILSQERIEELAGDIPLYASQAQERATQAAKAGNFREAMRLLYLAALLHLDEVGAIRFDRALTNHEVLASISDNASLRDLLTPVVRQFDRVWYGHAPFGAADFEQVSSQIERLRAMEA
jgi:hypothetical protein